MTHVHSACPVQTPEGRGVEAQLWCLSQHVLLLCKCEPNLVTSPLLGLQVLLKKNSKPVELPTSGTVRKVKAEDLAPKVNKGMY